MFLGYNYGIMLKYLVILVVFLGFAFVIARHDEDAALKSAQEPASQGNPSVAGVPDKDHPQDHKNDTAWDSPSGHIFHSAFMWPEGITVWAIILTLLAIAEQTKHTAKQLRPQRNRRTPPKLLPRLLLLPSNCRSLTLGNGLKSTIGKTPLAMAFPTPKAQRWEYASRWVIQPNAR